MSVLNGAQMAMLVPRHLEKWPRKMMERLFVVAFIRSSISTTFNQSLNARYGKVSNSSHFLRCILGLSLYWLMSPLMVKLWIVISRECNVRVTLFNF
ncbi:hypothetical protein MRB53_014063 [Persea americana]|uniref:Uncharacterized protein n=1 Tax=Persea americana TaxID=3435 RepID=A0ACC2K9V5_PERAE|nr:hypothetical protein MRB53_014063 [Persea americana]